MFPLFLTWTLLTATHTWDITVKERGTRKLLPNTKIILVHTPTQNTVELYTDNNGFAQHIDSEEGTWDVYIESEGHADTRTSETVQKNEKLSVVYYIEKSSYNPFITRVVGEKPRKEISRTSLSTTEIDKIAGNLGDPIAVVRNLPSVGRTAFGRGDIVVRGSAPEDTGVAVNGIGTPFIFHFGGLRSVIPTGMLDGIDFYPGNFSVYYGRATAGILDVRLKKTLPDRLNGYVDINLIDSNFLLSTPLGKKVSLTISARRSYVDLLLNEVTKKIDNVASLSLPRYYDYQSLLTWQITNKQTLRWFVYGSDDAFKLVLSKNSSEETSDKRISTATRFYRTMLEHQYRINTSLENEVKFSFGQTSAQFQAGKRYNFSLKSKDIQLRDTFTWRINPALSFRTGVDALLTYADVDITLPRPPKEGDAGNPSVYSTVVSSKGSNLRYWSPAVFAEADIQPLKALTITPGIRMDYYEQIDTFTVDPRISARYQLKPNLVLKGGIGIFHRPPTYDETDKQFGNPQLTALKATHYSLGAEYKPIDSLTVECTAFYKDLENIVSRSPAPEYYNNHGRGRVYGADVLIRQKFSHNVFGWIAYTVSRSERKDFNNTRWRLFDYDQTHILTVLGTYALPRNWEIGMRFRLVSGNPMTNITGSVYNFDNNVFTPVYGPVNQDRMKPFHQLDVRIDKKWVYNYWMLSVYLDIQNIYNQKNAENYSYNYDYSKRTSGFGLPVLPAFGVRGEF
jgi:outer membrane receptor for ferrienterochelin and colicin